MSRLGIAPCPRRRKATEAEVLDQLLIAGWPPQAILRRREAVTEEARTTLNHFVSMGLGFETAADGSRRYDPGELANLIVLSNLEGGDRFWSDRTLPLARRVIWQAHDLAPREDARPPPPSALPPRRFTLRLRRRFDLSDRAPGASVRLRLPLPIEDRALGELSLVFATPPGAPVMRSEGRLDVRTTVPPDGQIDLGLEATFTARPHVGRVGSPPLSPEDAALYTRPREGLIRVTDDVRALANEVAGGLVDDWSRVAGLWAFIAGRLRFGVINYEEVDPAHPWAWMLDNGWCDCQLGSAFLVSLCRALGIPARMLSGYVLDETASYHHYWSETWIAGRGWTPIDTASWSYARGGRDAAWKDYFVGELDYRMKTECLPRLFSGAGDVRLPPIAMRLSRLDEEGMALRFLDCDTRRLVYEDRLTLSRA
jgi:transglutaminase-like putative cysteine protease